MKIAVLDFNTNTVDVISVDDEWLENDLRDELSEWYEDEEWAKVDKDEKLNLFLFDYCGYSDGSIEYMCDYEKVQYLTPKDFN